MKISVVIPSFNQAHFIERTLLSVISQGGGFAIECIIMDGGSQDGTIEILQKYENQLKNGELILFCQSIDFIWKSESDKGQSDAINKGLRLATGDICTYLNSDDTYEPGALQKVAEVFATSDKKWCYGKCKIINENGREIRRWITLYKNILGSHYSYGKLLSENFISQMTVFWRREIMSELGLFDVDEHLCMDYEYWLRIGERYVPIYISEYIANFRFYQTSKSGSRFMSQFSDELRLAKSYAGNKYFFSLLVHKFNFYKIVYIYKILAIFGI